VGEPLGLPPCQACGAARGDAGSRFCLRCGAPLPAIYPGLVAHVIPSAAPTQPEPYATGVPAATPRRKRRGLWIALAIIFVFLACAIVVLVTNAIAIVQNGGSLF
jgi:hypothetical protein